MQDRIDRSVDGESDWRTRAVGAKLQGCFGSSHWQLALAVEMAARSRARSTLEEFSRTALEDANKPSLTATDRGWQTNENGRRQQAFGQAASRAMSLPRPPSHLTPRAAQ